MMTSTKHLFLSLIVCSLLACGSPSNTEDFVLDEDIELNEVDENGAAADSLTSTGTGSYYLISRQQLRCPDTFCNGYTITPVNKTTIKCPDGKTASSCYLGELDLSTLKFGAYEKTARDTISFDAGKILIRGSLSLKTFATASGTKSKHGKLKATEFWSSQTTSTATPSFFRVGIKGLVCSYFPCDKLKAQTLNSTSYSFVTEFWLPISTPLIDRDSSYLAAFSGQDVLVRGAIEQPGQQTKELRATQLFTRVVAPISTAKVCSTALTTTLESASQNLLYTSESDYPFTSVSYAGKGASKPTTTQFLTLIGKTNTTPIQTVSFSEWFAPRITDDSAAPTYDQATAAKYRLVKAALSAQLTDIQVFRVGEIEIDVYIVGRSSCGDLVGLKTTAIET